MDLAPLIKELKEKVVPMLLNDAEEAAKLAINAVLDFAENNLVPAALRVFATPVIELLRSAALKQADKIDGQPG